MHRRYRLSLALARCAMRRATVTPHRRVGAFEGLGRVAFDASAARVRTKRSVRRSPLMGGEIRITHGCNSARVGSWARVGRTAASAAQTRGCRKREGLSCGTYPWLNGLAPVAHLGPLRPGRPTIRPPPNADHPTREADDLLS